MGKKGGGSVSRVKTHEEVPSENDGVKLTGVLSTDLVALCEHERLPLIIVKPLRPSVPVADSSGEAVAEDTPSSKFAVLADWEDPDDPSTLHTLHMRGWLLSEKTLSILTEALSSFTRLHVLNLWNVGLTATTLHSVLTLAIQLNISALYLDGNTLSPEPLVELLTHKTSVELLSLKCCQLSDVFISQLTPALTDNRNLLHLDLSCNSLTDNGLIFLAAALRLNRTLLSLTLTNNSIGDEGVEALAEVLSEFPLNHEEVVMKRVMDSLQVRTDDGQSESGRSILSRERSASTASVDKRGGKSQASKSRKDAKKDEKGKKDDKGRKGGDSKKASREKETKSSKKGAEVTEEPVQSDPPLESRSPLLEAKKNGDQWLLPGNSALVFLGLSYNNISECGIASLLTTVRYQTSVFTAQAPGLLALTLHHNHLVPPTSSMLATLHDLLEQRNPLKVAETDPVIDTVESGT